MGAAAVAGLRLALAGWLRRLRLHVTMISFGIVGGGYWTERYLIICRELPHLFRLAGMVVRSAEKASALEAQ